MVIPVVEWAKMLSSTTGKIMTNVMNSFANTLVKPLLKSPLHPLMSRKLVLITYTGRKSGKAYTLPVEYTQHDHTLTILTWKNRTWWKNLEGGASVTVRLQGKEVNGKASVQHYDKEHATRFLKKRMTSWSDAQIAKKVDSAVVVTIHLVYR